ncbi:MULTISPECIES: hypothetical protein [Microbacterium]|jgi:hypothetical protein|uniref:hypothetical protein n=1 Tax=Microbacterium TaxID=33882 RepID=UPI001D1744CC|nr:hypothetical protein [Microbacterium testaceum]MCC4247912.1 hypothetical protein [Microbacterium testaceum]
MITTPVRDDIQAFAAAVRAHLDDLPTDDVDDLLDGLEADLSDQAAEAGDDFTLPDATTYAAELRAAAGLPDRSDSAPVDKRPTIRKRLADFRASADTQIRRNPGAAWLLDLLASLRPIWWVLRAVVLYLMIGPFFWSGYRSMSGMVAHLIGALQFPGIVLLAALLVLSVQWGRGRWAPNAVVRGIRTAVTVVTVLATPFTLAAIGGDLRSLVWDVPSDGMAAPYTSGLSLDGQRVRNIYAFDADGNPIPTVQLFDQNGTALTTVGNANGEAPFDSYFYGGGGPVPVPYTAPGAADAWNIYPLREIPAGVMSWDPAEDVERATEPTFPFLRVQPVPTGVAPTTGAEADVTPQPTPTPAAPTP